MFKFLAKHSGKICTVLGVIGVVIGLGALIAAPYVVVPICVGITAGVFLGAAAISGACYIGREYGKYSERESNKKKEEELRRRELENSKNIHHVIQSDSVEIDHEIEMNKGNKSYFLMQKELDHAKLELKNVRSDVNTIRARISKIEEEQTTRAFHHSLEELHRERDKYGIKASSDSDSESEETLLLSEQSIFAENKLRNRRSTSQAANDVAEDIGVTLRYKNQS